MSDFLTRISHFSPKRLALLADELNDKVARLEAAGRDASSTGSSAAIAIIGIGCRLPGSVDSPAAYWDLLQAGRDAISEVPRERFDIDALYDPDPDVAGKISTRFGGFVGAVDGFDAGFFGIAPREAQSMDPQQRLLLETSWRALEDAGIAPPSLEGSRTGVFLGVSASDYHQLLRNAAGMAGFDAYTASGTAHSIASGRLSYTLGLRGPSLSIDTACSSSMVAIHQAVASLRRGEIDLALAGGVNLILAPDISIALSRARMMAPDGRCKAFDARADGFVRGEGCGVLVLQRLADAERDAPKHGRRVWAVIRGSAANQDGRSNGLTAPNGPAQVAVLREALADAGVQPHEVGFVEAHGTGTSLGDPIEVQALDAVYGAGRPHAGKGSAVQGEAASPSGAAAPLWVGSAKANIGHLEAAAGVAGVIKAVLVLRHGQVPGQLHVQTPNPYIPWDRFAVQVPRALTPWPTGAAAPRRAGVSSFGFSGTNVHLVLEEATARPPAAPAAPPVPAALGRPLHIFAVSARSEAALAALGTSCAHALETPGAAWPDLAHASTAGRAHFSQRAAVVAASAREAAAGLLALAPQASAAAAAQADSGHHGVQRARLHRGTTGVRAPRVAFLFTGQGSQYAGMARALYEGQPGFRASLERCDELLRPLLPRPLLGVLFPAAGEVSPIDDTAFAQPALFAIEYSLAQLWISWGVRPHALLGHSVGEIAAACIAGVFSLEDALKLVAARGALMSALPRDGGMAAVAADEARVRALLTQQGPSIGTLDIAALNGPASTVVSGSEPALQALCAQLQASGIHTTRLQVSHAFHSALMEPMLGPFDAVLAGLRLQPPQLDLFSNLSGARAGAEVATPEYWRRHVRGAVRFAPAMGALAAEGIDLFIEIGPHPVLLGLGADCIEPGPALRWLPSLRRGHDDWATLLGSVAEAHVAGVPVDWPAFDAPYPWAHASLPGYPFQRERYWVAAGAGTVADAAQHSTVVDMNTGNGAAPALLHPLLGHEVLHPLGPDRLFEARLHTRLQPWLNDHRIQGSVVLPSPVCMEIALAAAHAHGPERLNSTGEWHIEDLTVHRALPVDGEQPITVHTVLSPQADGSAALKLSTLEAARRSSQADDRHDTLATAHLRHVQVAARATEPALASGALDDPSALAEVQARNVEAVDVDGYYAWLARLGLSFGPAFRGVQRMQRSEGEVLARVELPAELSGSEGAYTFHPALLDACFHVVGAALPGAVGTLADAFLLMHVRRLRVRAPLGRAAWVHVRVDDGAPQDLTHSETFSASLRLLGDGGELLAAFEGMSFKRARPGALHPPARLPQRIQAMLHEVVWREAPHAPPALSASQLAGHFTPALPALAQKHGFAHYAEFVPALDRLASGYIRQALAQLGVALTPGARVGAHHRAALGIEARHQRLFARLLDIASEDGWLRREDDGAGASGSSDSGGDGGDYVVSGMALPGDPEALGKVLLQRHPDASAELQLTQRCGRELAAVLRGRADPVALLFPGGSLADTERLYRDSPAAQAYNSLIADIVLRIAAAPAAQATQRPLRVLEVGAGTGSTTAYVLPRLAAVQEGRAGSSLHYTFTDVSPLFLNRARDKFAAAHTGFEARLLDIGEPPETQGFEPGSFDIVIGANVLHATPDLARTVSHVHSLLAPGGRLVLLEGVLPQRFGDLTVGLLEGWWAYTDTERRSYALMSRRQWLQLLADTGFADAAALPGDSEHVVWKQQAIFVADVPAASAPLGASQATPLGVLQATLLTDSSSAPRAAARWWLLADQQGVAAALAQRLRARGDRVELLPAHAKAQPEMAAAVHRLLNDGPAPAGVLALAALDLTPDMMRDPAHDGATLMAAQERVLGPCLALAQALADATTPLPLWFITQGAQPASADATAPAQATLWGLGHVVALEQPQLHCRRLDLDPRAPLAVNVQALLAEIDTPDGEDQIALRAARSAGEASIAQGGGCVEGPLHGSPAQAALRRPDHGRAHEPRADEAHHGMQPRMRRLVRRLHPAARQATGHRALSLSAERCYLITGGLAGLGLRVARWLVERGARHLALLGRRSPNPAAEAEIAALRARGAAITVHQGDVADEATVARLMAQLRASPTPLAGIVHAAGALADAVLTRQTWSHFEAVMAAKVRGSWNLHRLAGELDFLVFFSSGASVGGSPGQANHAAANAFEDALAWHRHAAGQPTLSVNWGPWAEIGAAAERRLARPGGLHPIEPADGLMALEHLMHTDAQGLHAPAQMAVLAIDSSHLRAAREAGTESTLLRDLVLPAAETAPRGAGPAPSSTPGARGATPPAATEPSLSERLAAALPNRRRALLREHVRALAARVLGLPRPDALPPEEPLRQLGLDSLMAVELRNLLGKAVGHTLPATITFDHPSVSALAEHLAAASFADHFAHLGPAAPTVPAASAANAAWTPAPSPAAAEALDGLDADALAERLMSRLDQLG